MDIAADCVNPDDITEYYDTHGVPEEEQYVPAMVIGDRYLFAAEEIVLQLMEASIAGEGLNTPILNGRWTGSVINKAWAKGEHGEHRFRFRKC